MNALNPAPGITNLLYAAPGPWLLIHHQSSHAKAISALFHLDIAFTFDLAQLHCSHCHSLLQASRGCRSGKGYYADTTLADRKYERSTTSQPCLALLWAAL